MIINLNPELVLRGFNKSLLTAVSNNISLNDEFKFIQESNFGISDNF